MDDTDEKRERKAAAAKRWRESHRQGIQAYRKKYKQEHRAQIRLAAQNRRRLMKVQPDNTTGNVHLTPAQIDLLGKLYPNVGPMEGIRLLLVAEATRRLSR